MAYRIAKLSACEILDSRGRPALEVEMALRGGAHGFAGVPSGASTGTAEAVERRDGDPSRFGGAGLLSVVATVEEEIAEAVTGRDWESLADLDNALCTLDGTPNKARLGANAIVGVSMAAARTFAAQDEVPLYQWLSPEGYELRLPVPHFNVVNGGAHAKNLLDIQEFMIAPLGAPSFHEALRAGAEIYAALRDSLDGLGFATSLGDEGGFAPALQAPGDVLDLLVASITMAGYQPGPEGVAIALDLAATGFREADGQYRLNGTHLDSVGLIDYVEYLLDHYPIWSIEDAMAEDDQKGWELATQRLGDRVQLVGDDNFVTNPTIVADAISHRVGNAALIKVNQVGTVSETLAAVDVCRQAGYGAMVSHRSGETTDAFIADLVVAIGCGQIKAGAPARGERLSKYNRLMSIEQADPGMPYGFPRPS